MQSVQRVLLYHSPSPASVGLALITDMMLLHTPEYYCTWQNVHAHTNIQRHRHTETLTVSHTCTCVHTHTQINVCTHPATRFSLWEKKFKYVFCVGATRGVTVSTSAFLACHKCYCAGSSLAWGLNIRAVVCGIFWSSSPGVFSGYSGFLPSFIGLMIQPTK